MRDDQISQSLSFPSDLWRFLFYTIVSNSKHEEENILFSWQLNVYDNTIYVTLSYGQV